MYYAKDPDEQERLTALSNKLVGIAGFLPMPGAIVWGGSRQPPLVSEINTVIFADQEMLQRGVTDSAQALSWLGPWCDRYQPMLSLIVEPPCEDELRWMAARAAEIADGRLLAMFTVEENRDSWLDWYKITSLSKLPEDATIQ